MRRKALIYSNELSGHRQIYCDVLTDVLLQLGYHVILAVGLSTCKQESWPHIQQYASNSNVSILDINLLSSSSNYISKAHSLATLQQELDVDVTILACGDEMYHDLREIGRGNAPRIQGWSIGIFGITELWFPRDSIFAPGISFWERPNDISFRIREYISKSAFFDKTICLQRVLNSVLVRDERVAEHKGPPFYWFPDIFHPFNYVEDTIARQQYAEIVPLYKHFLEEQPGKEILLYFGSANSRKGYDILLELAMHDPDICFVHCGDFGSDLDKYSIDVKAARQRLREEHRYFETGCWLLSWDAVNVFWQSIQRFVLTHRVYWSSGTMLQALDAGKPILVPARGLVQFRTMNYGLGRIYKPCDFADLQRTWDAFKREPVSWYTPNISQYMKKYTRDSLITSIVQALGPYA